MRPERHHVIQALFDQYIEMYAARDDRLTERFSQNFSGFTGGGDFLVKDREQWVKITRLDFSEVPSRIKIEILDLSLQDLCEDVVVATAFFHIHLPFAESILSQETARLVLIFRLEGEQWMIVNSTISIPYYLVQPGEVYPIGNLYERNRELEELVELRTKALEETNAKLEMMSNTDALTAISNRRRFDQILAQEWERGKRAGTSLALIMIDVDHFKHYNDHYGHLAGDTCLRALARALEQGGQRAGDLVARYGGEEFVVLLPNTNTAGAMKIAQVIQQEVWALQLPHAESSPGIVTVSLGVASFVPTRRDNPEDLLRLTDVALYQAKQSGRNCIMSSEDRFDAS
jgi:diguanylate cyclase (GGDEF)-like protein